MEEVIRKIPKDKFLSTSLTIPLNTNILKNSAVAFIIRESGNCEL